MTVKHSKHIARRAVRAQLRQGPPWTLPDALLLFVFVLIALTAIISPAVLADFGNAVIGSTTFLPDLGTSWSGVIHVVMRLLIVAGVGYVLLAARETPWAVRMWWTVAALGLMCNYARSIYSGSESTASFFLLQIALLGLLFRLSTRPTVWVQVRVERERADAAEARVAELEAELRGRDQ